MHRSAWYGASGMIPLLTDSYLHKQLSMYSKPVSIGGYPLLGGGIKVASVFKMLIYTDNSLLDKQADKIYFHKPNSIKF